MSAPFHLFVLKEIYGRFPYVSQELCILIGCLVYVTQVIACQYANNYWYGVADDTRTQRVGLPPRARGPLVSTHVEDNKLETLRQDQKEPRTLSRISRCVLGIIRYLFKTVLKVTIGIMNFSNIL